MVLLIKGLAGPYQNKHFKIASGMTLGRKQGDILLELDNTISSLHGRVILQPNGLLTLQDASSQNQFLVNNQKVESVILIEGAVFQIGQCVFKVLKMTEKEASQLQIEKNWKDLVFEALENNKELGPSAAHALSPPVIVECHQGPSAEFSWFLGFGPRLFGPLCEDIEILEKDSGDHSFEIFQGDHGPHIRVHSQNILINRSARLEKQLEDGDEIQVGSSIFKIRLG
jgi:pSer/pThr/pTyr-binding forkhead associated (FHA) protein